MPATSYLNSPVRCCETCIHCQLSDHREYVNKLRFAHCARFMEACKFSTEEQWGGKVMCGHALREWRPKPPPPPKIGLFRRIWRYLFA